MINKILHHSIRIIVGAVFCFSAYTKLRPIEPFEMIFVELHVTNWEFASILARMVISAELLLGLLLISNLIPKTTRWTTLFVLLFFTIYLVYVLINEGNSDNCGCFGIMINMNPIESIIKNLILIGLIVFLLFSRNTLSLKWRFNKLLLYTLIIGSIALPIILNPPDFIIHYNRPPEKTGYNLHTDEMGPFIYEDSTYQLSEGKKILCFFSLNCKFCKLAAKKITIIQKRLEKPLPVFYLFLGEEKYLEAFWNESKSYHFPYKLIDPLIFFKLSGNRLPAIYFLKNDTVSSKLNFDELSEKEVKSFITD